MVRSQYKAISIACFGVLLIFMVVLSPASVVAVSGASPTPIHYLFREDFVTRANRWRIFDNPKAAIRYGVNGLDLSTTATNYALWSYPDTELRLSEYQIETEFTFINGDDDTRAGLLVNFHSDDDLTVLVISQSGRIYLGHYYFGVWRDILPPSQVLFDVTPDKPIVIAARVDSQQQLIFSVDGRPVMSTTLDNFKPGSFGVFVLSGLTGNTRVTFRRYQVDEIEPNKLVQTKQAVTK